LWLETVEVDAGPEEAGRRTGLEPAHAKTKGAQHRRQGVRRALADPPAGRLFEAHVEQTAQKRPGREHKRPPQKLPAGPSARRTPDAIPSSTISSATSPSTKVRLGQAPSSASIARW
jgi:hypothetical protein